MDLCCWNKYGVLNRDFHVKIKLNPENTRDSVFVCLHPNSVAVIGVTEFHFVLSETVSTSSISVQFLQKPKNQRLNVGTTICNLNYFDKKTNSPMVYEFQLPISGKLLELNTNITDEGLRKNPMKEGYIAIVQQTGKEASSKQDDEEFLTLN
jgi:glycine cleavage system H lipoate-binding protein